MTVVISHAKPKFTYKCRHYILDTSPVLGKRLETSNCEVHAVFFPFQDGWLFQPALLKKHGKPIFSLTFVSLPAKDVNFALLPESNMVFWQPFLFRSLLWDVVHPLTSVLGSKSIPLPRFPSHIFLGIFQHPSVHWTVSNCEFKQMIRRNG